MQCTVILGHKGHVFKRCNVNETTKKRKKAKFLRCLRSNGGFVRSACKAAGVAKTPVYIWKKEDPDFSEDWDDAIVESGEAVEENFYAKCIGDKSETDAQKFYLARKLGYKERNLDDEEGKSVSFHANGLLIPGFGTTSESEFEDEEV